MTVSYFQWITSAEMKTNKNGQTVSVKLTRKETVESTLQNMLNEFNKQIARFKKHLFTIRHQYAQYRHLKGTLATNECMIHIDFSENYMCQYASEIQSVHFGASHAQATLHNGVFYTNVDENLLTTSFCTISDSRHHGPPAIWVYLDPVLKLVKSVNPLVDTIHFFSDSPSTQYRQKLNFYFFCTKIQEYGFQRGTWNFSEAGHGKGAADGVGGALKRTADRLISLNSDINTPRRLFDALCSSGSSVSLFYVDSDVVNRAMENAPSTVKSIPGTMSIHQLTSSQFGTFNYRDVSCFCSKEKCHCECYDVKKHSFDVTLPDAVSPLTVIDNPAPIGVTGDSLQPVLDICPELVGQYCLVRYDGNAYPGKILDVDADDDDALVLCMAKVGENRFFWPTVYQDVAWYMRQDILTLIGEPKPVGRGRHCEVDPHTWKLIRMRM